MPYGKTVYEQLRVQPDEHRALLLVRLESLDHATQQTTLEGPLPVRWRVGWTATLRILKRDADGSLCARVTCRGPGLSRDYVRNVRLCKQHALRLSEG